MKFIMATEAQRLISISLAKIAASRCVRGGVSLHKNLLVATVLQKARYIFMEEAFHMVHGHYINQANSKFIQELRHEEHRERHLRQHNNDVENNESVPLSDSELDLFSSSIDSNESLNFLNDSNSEDTSTIENCDMPLNSSSKSSPEIVHLDILDIKSKTSEGYDRKRRHIDSNDDSTLLPPKSKLMKLGSNKAMSILNESEEFKNLQNQAKNSHSDNMNIRNNINSSSSINSENSSNKSTSLNFLSNDLSSTNENNSRTNVMMTPLDMSYSTSTNTTNLPISPISSSIDRITSLVSIFNFGNLQRSVSAPDLCSSSSKHTPVDNNSCNLQQRQIAMTV
jgi:hypothetical protein